ncbi:MAG: serine/threonine-protein kinase [Pseudomonadota bacterium]
MTDLRPVTPYVDSGQAEEAPESELPVPEGELLGGRYLVERIFAEGGMGIVCYGRHLQLEQPVAIKFLRRALAGKPSVVERFLNEGRALAALRSEHVVRVMDVGQLESGRPYLVMEHLDGIDLDTLVDRDGPLSVETAVSYALQICEPLAEAHALGIVHRDIKPENLFLWSGGPREDIVKVLDFGLAKQFGSPRAMAVTGPQDSMGSPCYMSPEQITTPQNIDSRTDIWSLGVVLHRLLTDSLPFDGGNVLEVLSHVLSAAPKSLHEARPELDFDPELDAIVHRCLEKLPAARYQTMAELSQALSAYLARRAAGVSVSQPLPAVAPDPRVLPAGGVFEGDDEKIRIAGVHPRWPAVLLLGVALAAAAAYQVDRIGKLRIRARVEGILVPARLAPDAVWTVPDHFQPALIVSRGVYAAEPTRDASGALALRAEPERDTEAEAPVAAQAMAPLSDAERAAKEAAYRDYLKSEGLTSIGEALHEMGTN